MTRAGGAAGWVTAMVLAAVLAGCKGGGTPTVADLKTDDDKTLYALGVSMGGNLSPFGLNAEEIGTVQKGFADGASGAKPQVDMQVYGPKIRELAEARAARNASAQKEKAKPFLDAAAGEKGAVRTDSGMIYSEMQKGPGATPQANDSVSVHYRGTLTDGTEFDSSYKRNQPAEFKLGEVIPCFREGIQRMAVGGKAKLVCPSSLAYGDHGSPPVIPPGATLVFEVELLGIAGK